jgi:uncharacterized Zn-finger protein
MLCRCEVCDVYFVFKKTFLKHAILHQYDFNEVDDVRQDIPCKTCGIHLGSVIDYNQHIVSHVKETGLKLGIVEQQQVKIPITDQNLEKSSEEPVSHRCLYCPRKFLDRKQLVAHLACHEKDRPFQCLTCFKRFKRKNNWKEHLDTHQTELKYHCDVCDRKFISKRYLRSHSYNHQKKRSFICPVEGCEKNMKTKQALEQHLADSLKCLKCDLIFHDIDSLADHQAKDHEEKSCQYCAQVFCKEQSLMEHQMICKVTSEADGDNEEEMDEEIGDEEELTIDEEYFD